MWMEPWVDNFGISKNPISRKIQKFGEFLNDVGTYLDIWNFGAKSHDFVMILFK